MKRAMTKEVRRWRWWIGAVVAVTRRGRSPSQGLSQRLFIPPSSPPSLSPLPRQHHPTRHHTRLIPLHFECILTYPTRIIPRYTNCHDFLNTQAQVLRDGRRVSQRRNANAHRQSFQKEDATYAQAKASSYRQPATREYLCPPGSDYFLFRTLTIEQSPNEPANFAPSMPFKPTIFEHGLNDA